MFVALYADETVPYKEIVKILNIANENKFKMVLATVRRNNRYETEYIYIYSLIGTVAFHGVSLY